MVLTSHPHLTWTLCCRGPPPMVRASLEADLLGAKEHIPPGGEGSCGLGEPKERGTVSRIGVFSTLPSYGLAGWVPGCWPAAAGGTLTPWEPGRGPRVPSSCLQLPIGRASHGDPTGTPRQSPAPSQGARLPGEALSASLASALTSAVPLPQELLLLPLLHRAFLAPGLCDTSFASSLCQGNTHTAFRLNREHPSVRP